MAQKATPQQIALFEGHAVELHKCQFAGAWDLEENEANVIGLDRVVVFLVAGRITKAAFELQESSGELHRKTVAKVSDARMLRGKLRDEALSFLVQGPDQFQLDFTAPQVGGADDLEDELELELAEAVISNGHADTGPSSLGSVYPAGRPRDDKLAAFLESPAP